MWSLHMTKARSSYRHCMSGQKLGARRTQIRPLAQHRIMPAFMFSKIWGSPCCLPRAVHHGIQDLWRQQVVLLLILFRLLPSAAGLLLPGDMRLGCPLRICMRTSQIE